MIPESQPLAFDVDVCATESVFIHVTVVPAAISRLSGVNARFPNTSAPIGIVTVDDGPPVAGGGVGEGFGEGEDGDEVSPPQATARRAIPAARAKRRKNMMASAVCNLRRARNIPRAINSVRLKPDTTRPAKAGHYRLATC